MVAGLVLVLTPAAASAKPGYRIYPGSHDAELSIQGSHGYALQITEANRRRVEVLVNRPPSVVGYLVRSAPLKGDGIRARLSGIGRIAMSFHAVGAKQREPQSVPGCRGGDVTDQDGYFQGSIRLRGERGYTTANASRVRGRVETRTREVCRRSESEGSGNPRHREEKTSLEATAASAGRLTRFSALTLGMPALGSPPFTTFFASVTEHRDGMGIFRETIARGAPREFEVADTTSPHPAWATVTPPAPFLGSAEYQRGDEADPWSGTLAISFPGIGKVQLAGPRFTADLCRNSGCPANR